MSKKMTMKWRAIARGASKPVVVFPRADVTMTASTSAYEFANARRVVTRASKAAVASVARHELSVAE